MLMLHYMWHQELAGGKLVFQYTCLKDWVISENISIGYILNDINKLFFTKHA